MAKSKKLEDLFHDTLKDIYFAEKKILASLPKMTKAAQHADLKAAFEKHTEKTKAQIVRLEDVFAEIGKKPQGKLTQLPKSAIFSVIGERNCGCSNLVANQVLRRNRKHGRPL